MKILSHAVWSRVVLTALCGLAATAHAELTRYELTDLGDLPGGLDLSVASDINDAGLIVGHSHVGSGSRAFVWDPIGGMRQLFPDTQPRVSGLGGYTVFTTDFHVDNVSLNNAGVVVGRANGGFIFQSIDQPLKVYNDTIMGINDQGQLITGGYVGRVNTPASQWLTLQGATAGGASQARALNEAGTVVGEVMLPGGEWDAVYWDAQGKPTSLGARPNQAYASAFAVAVNESGAIAGFRNLAGGGSTAYVWSPAAGLVDIGGIEGEAAPYAQSALDINDQGQVIGRYGYEKSFIWTPEDGVADLDALINNAPYHQAFNAMAINNAGEIVGTMQMGPDSWRAVLLSPVPEPGTLGLHGLGLAMMVGASRWRRRG